MSSQKRYGTYTLQFIKSELLQWLSLCSNQHRDSVRSLHHPHVLCSYSTLPCAVWHQLLSLYNITLFIYISKCGRPMRCVFIMMRGARGANVTHSRGGQIGTLWMLSWKEHHHHYMCAATQIKSKCFGYHQLTPRERIYRTLQAHTCDG